MSAEKHADGSYLTNVFSLCSLRARLCMCRDFPNMRRVLIRPAPEAVRMSRRQLVRHRKRAAEKRAEQVHDEPVRVRSRGNVVNILDWLDAELRKQRKAKREARKAARNG